MKTILCFGNVLYPDKDAASHRTIGNAKALREMGYRVVLVGTKEGENRPVLETKEVFEGFDIYYFSDPKSPSQWSGYLFGYEPLKSVLEIKKDVKAVILYNHPAISTKKILAFCRKKGIKVYADCTEWFDPKGFSVHTLIKKIDTWYRMSIVNARLDGIIAISSFLQNYYKKKGCHTICVPPLVDLMDAKWDNEECQESEKVKLCYVGNSGAGTKDKLDMIIASLKRIKGINPELEFQLDIVGMTKVQYEVAFKDNSGEYGFVNFWGRRPNQETLSIVKKSDYSIFLRDKNLICTAGFPTKFSESIACGTPVLTNLTSDLHKYLKEGYNGFVIDITNNEVLDDTIKKALTIPRQELNRMKKCCRDEKTFDYHSFIEEFAKLF